MASTFQSLLDECVPLIVALGRSARPVFIPISGPDATGKTQVARQLKERLGDALVVTTDWYLASSREDRLRAARDGKSGYWLELHDEERLFRDLDRLKRGLSIRTRTYDAAEGTTREVAGAEEGPAPFIIVDSGLSLTDPLWNAYPPERFAIFITADAETRRILKARRDRKDRNYEALYLKFGEEAVERFIRHNLRDCERIVMPTVKRADLIAEIDSDYRVLDLRLVDQREDLAEPTERSSCLPASPR